MLHRQRKLCQEVLKLGSQRGVNLMRSALALPPRPETRDGFLSMDA